MLLTPHVCTRQICFSRRTRHQALIEFSVDRGAGQTAPAVAFVGLLCTIVISVAVVRYFEMQQGLNVLKPK